MRQPTINQYIETIKSPYGMFKTIGEVGAERDTYDRVRLRSGNSAVIFKIFIDGKAHMLKCYIKQGYALDEKYEYLATIAAECGYIASAKLLTDEIFVYDHKNNGHFFDVVLAPWVEGMPLNLEIEWAADRADKQKLADLAAKFDRLAYSLIRQKWAHGDLKPENIIVDQNGELILIDYDAVFIPSLPLLQTPDVGTETFQHPRRDANMYDKHIDDYSIALICVSLHALAEDPSLYEAYHKGDNIILDPKQIVEGKSELFHKIEQMWSEKGDTMLFRLTQALTSETPYLHNLETLLANIADSQPDNQSNPNLTPVRCDGLWGYRNDGSEIVIEPIYDNAYEFSCGLAAVSLRGTWHFIDHRNKVVINCAEYNRVKPFSRNLAAVCKNDLWGYIHTDGGLVIEPKYTMAGSFHEDLAVVQHKGKYGYINSRGEWHISPEFEHATSFKNQKAEVQKNGKIYYIDKLNNIF